MSQKRGHHRTYADSRAFTHSGNAMDSCTLGKQGRLACPDQTCAEDTFVVYCEDLNGVNITQWVDMGELDQYRDTILD